MLLGITGHRPKYYPKSPTWISNLENQVLDFLNSNDITMIYAGGAIGFDQLVIDCAIDLGLRYTLCLPDHDFNKKWSKQDMAKHDNHVFQADDVLYFGKSFNVEHYRLRNTYIVNNSSAMLALFNRHAQRSGTGMTVRIAANKGIPVYNLWDTLNQSRMRF